HKKILEVLLNDKVYKRLLDDKRKNTSLKKARLLELLSESKNLPAVAGTEVDMIVAQADLLKYKGGT
ncbi:MAG: hypothetical protein QXD77_03270, partial [Candidatus Aenigmatarchaeota archaeon]